MMVNMEGRDSYRYQQVAEFIVELIRKGILRGGMRAPSLREIARQQNISVTTAQLAYQQLEDRGILQARAKSGFFVTQHSVLSLPTPSQTAPPIEAQKSHAWAQCAQAFRPCIKSEDGPLGVCYTG